MSMDRIVAVEVTPERAEIFLRSPSGELFCQRQEFFPWLLAESTVPVPEGVRAIPLAGNAPLNRRWEFTDPESYEKNLPELKKTPGIMTVRELSCQFLSISGCRLFGGMDFNELKRLQIAVIPDSGNNSIAAIELSADAVAVKRFDLNNCPSELEIIAAFDRELKLCDPDIIEGFNIFREGLPLLEKRAKKYKYTFSCGRDGSAFASRKSRFSVAEKQISFNRYSLYGRHLVDLYHLMLFYDAVHRDFESFEFSWLREYFKTAPDLSDCVAVGRLCAMLLPAYFYKCCTLPLSLPDCILRGSGAALDSLFIAEYQRAGHSVPYPETSRSFTGALTRAGESGVYHQVRHCDVRSLYPSILLWLGRNPVRDELGVFTGLLKKLRTFRLEAKDRARSASGAEKQRFTALQNTFKILINSFYGYLGFAQGCFNDYALAETVTATGRELLSQLADKLGELGGTIVEMDTDGIYFTMPDDPDVEFDRRLASVLPEEITLEFDASYPAMYCYKSKNYALLHEDGTISVSGAALKSRALEPFQREFIQAVLKSKLLDDPGIMEETFRQLKMAISGRTIPLDKLAKSEVLSDSPESYKRKQSSPNFRRSAPYELALASGKTFRAGDKVEFYVTGTKAKLPVVGNSRLLSDADPGQRDENTAYYLAKLDELYKQFK